MSTATDAWRRGWDQADATWRRQQHQARVDRRRPSRARVLIEATKRQTELERAYVDAKRRGSVPDALARRWHRARLEASLDETSREAQRLRAFACDLARQLDVTLEFTAPGHEGAAALHASRHVVAAPLRGTYSFAVVLHELGHFAVGDRFPRRADGVSVAAEIAAWRWARRQANGLWDPDAQAALVDALSTYLMHATPDEARALREALTC